MATEPSLNQSFFARERTRGFIFAFLAFGVVGVVQEFISIEKPWYFSGIPSIIGSVIFFAAFFSLNNEKYKKYAQGALLGWPAFVVVALGIKILTTI